MTGMGRAEPAEAAGRFGLRDSSLFKQQESCIVMIPIESLDAYGGQAG